MQQGEIVIYKAFDSTEFQIEVRVEDETSHDLNLSHRAMIIFMATSM